MEKREVAPYVYLTDEQYERLHERYGKDHLEKRIHQLSKKKQNGEKPLELSDYHSLRTKGMQLVEPIRNRDDIQLMKRILKRDSLRNYFLFSLGLNTGMRISDFIGLRVNDVLNRKHIEVIEKKTGKTRRFKVNFELQQDIHEYVEGMANTDYLFPSKKTKEPISRVQAYRILRKAADRAGLQSIGTHSMRKSLGYHFYNQTKDVAILQEIFNHSTPQITKRYIGIRQDEIDESLDDFYL